MSSACPHCRNPVTVHPQTGAWPAFCAHCGQRLEPAAATEANEVVTPNLASLLRPVTTAASESPTPAAAPLVSEEPAPAELFAAPVEPAPGAEAQLEAEVTAVDTAEAESTPAIAEPTPAPVEAEAEVEAGTTVPSTAPPPPVVIPSVPASAAPSFMQRQRRNPTVRHGRWQWAAVIALGVLLVLQILIADRHRLATQAGWRPLLGSLCTALSCDLPAWRDPQAFTMISRDVRPLPQRPGVLLAQATFRNDARWSQPWPILMVTLKDADGRTLGARALQPAEYLDRQAQQDEIAPGQSAQVAVRLREPSASVVAFSFDFR